MRTSIFVILCSFGILLTACNTKHSSNQHEASISSTAAVESDSVLKEAKNAAVTVGNAANDIGSAAVTKVEHLGKGVKNGVMRIVDGAEIVGETSAAAGDTAVTSIKIEAKKVKTAIEKSL